MPPQQTRGHWSKSSHLVESLPSQTNSWSSPSPVCSRGSDLPGRAKNHRLPENTLPITCQCFIESNNANSRSPKDIQEYKCSKTDFPKLCIYECFISGIQRIKPLLPANPKSDRQLHTCSISVKLKLVLIYSNQVTTPLWECSWSMLCTCFTLWYFLSCFAHILPCCKLCNHISCVLLLWWHQQVETHRDAECALQYTHTHTAGLIRTQGWVDLLGWVLMAGERITNCLPNHRGMGHCSKQGSYGKQLGTVESHSTEWGRCCML